jgi:hypothetical protein
MSAVDDARKKVEHEFQQFRKHLDSIRVAMEAVEKAGPEDELEGLLKKLEDAVKEARTGGLIGSGAKGHARALKKLAEAQATDATPQ